MRCQPEVYSDLINHLSQFVCFYTDLSLSESMTYFKGRVGFTATKCVRSIANTFLFLFLFVIFC